MQTPSTGYSGSRDSPTTRTRTLTDTSPDPSVPGSHPRTSGGKVERRDATVGDDTDLLPVGSFDGTLSRPSPSAPQTPLRPLTEDRCLRQP